MKKILIGTLLAGSILFASENSWFIGISGGKLDYNVEISNRNENFKFSDSGSALTLKVGKYITQNDIIAISSTGVAIEDATDATMGIGELSYKHIFDIDKLILLLNNEINFFAGVSYGVIVYEEDMEDGKTVKWNTNTLYADIGLLSKVSDSIDIELGYKKSLFSNGDKEVRINGVDVTFEFTDTSRWYLGINYKF